MEISTFNDATMIILDNEICHIIIDKVNHTIIQTRHFKNAINKDVTEECEKMEKEYGITYTGGVIASKILNNRINKKCIRFIKNFNIELK